MKLTPPFILLIASGASLVLALALSGGSLGWSVKWNSYNSFTDFCSTYKYKLSAYQSLWMSYDQFNYDKTNYGQVYRTIKNDDFIDWRELVRLLIFASLGIGTIALSFLLSTLVPVVSKNPFVLNAVRITTIIFSTGNGAVLAYAVYKYKTSYRLLWSPTATDPKACYPLEDNLTTGFYMASFACSLYAASAVMNVVILVLDIKKNRKNDVIPS